jgi:class 3 adenylate cyclase
MRRLYLTLAGLVVLALVMAKIFSVPGTTAGDGTAIVFGLYFGLLGAVGIYHLLMYAVLGGRDFLAYGVYVAALALVQLARSKYYALFFSGVHITQTVVFWFAYALFSVAAYWLFQSLLLLPLLQPRINRIVRWLTGIAALLCLAAPWLHVSQLIEALSLITLLFVFYAGWRALQKGLRAARYFTVAFAGMFAGAIATVVWLNFGHALPPALSSLLYGFQIGTVFQALALALGIADRIQVANEERDRTQRHALEETTSLNVAYARFVPRTFLELLGKTDIRDVALGDQVARTMTIFFSDVRSFTTLSEAMTPAETFGFINGLLSRTGPIVREHNGIIDKYIGDAIMALFPRSADDALAAGIEVQREVARHNAVRAEAGRVPIAVGIGLHTGKLMLGTIGEHERMDGTVIADAVNLASRIESLTKSYGAAMMISDETRASLRDPSQFELRFVGRVAVKGKSDGVGLYEVLDAEEPAIQERRRANSAQFDRAVTQLRDGDFTGAERTFGQVCAADPLDRAAAFLRTRCAELTTSERPWDGVDYLSFK